MKPIAKIANVTNDAILLPHMHERFIISSYTKIKGPIATHRHWWPQDIGYPFYPLTNLMSHRKSSFYPSTIIHKIFQTNFSFNVK